MRALVPLALALASICGGCKKPMPVHASGNVEVRDGKAVVAFQVESEPGAQITYMSNPVATADAKGAATFELTWNTSSDLATYVVGAQTPDHARYGETRVNVTLTRPLVLHQGKSITCIGPGRSCACTLLPEGQIEVEQIVSGASVELNGKAVPATRGTRVGPVDILGSLKASVDDVYAGKPDAFVDAPFAIVYEDGQRAETALRIDAPLVKRALHSALYESRFHGLRMPGDDASPQGMRGLVVMPQGKLVGHATRLDEIDYFATAPDKAMRGDCTAPGGGLRKTTVVAAELSIFERRSGKAVVFSEIIPAPVEPCPAKEPPEKAAAFSDSALYARLEAFMATKR